MCTMAFAVCIKFLYRVSETSVETRSSRAVQDQSWVWKRHMNCIN